jgi:hypothetical protein
MRFDAPNNIDERLHRAECRLELLSSMLFAVGAGDSIELRRRELRTLAGYLDDIRDDLREVSEAPGEGD